MTVVRLITPILLVLAVLLGACSDGQPRATLAPESTLSATAIPTRQATGGTVTPSAKAAILTLKLASGQVAPGREFSLDVQLDPHGRGISGVQFDLHFPAGQIEVLDIQPGTLLGPDPLDFKKVKDEPGVVVYAAARRGATRPGTAAGRFATVRLRVLDDVAVGTNFQVWLQEVQIADENIQRVAEVVTNSPLALAVVAP